MQNEEVRMQKSELTFDFLLLTLYFCFPPSRSCLSFL